MDFIFKDGFLLPYGVIKAAKYYDSPTEMFKFGMNLEQDSIKRALGGLGTSLAGVGLSLINRHREESYRFLDPKYIVGAGVMLAADGAYGTIIGAKLQDYAGEIFKASLLDKLKVIPNVEP